MVGISYPPKSRSASVQATLIAKVVLGFLLFRTLIYLFSGPSEEEIIRTSPLFNSNTSLLTITKTESSNFEVSFPQFTEKEGRLHIISLFREAGHPMTPEMEANLPTWSQVQKVIGPHPYILGLDRCEKFRKKVPPIERMLGAAGMFNTGTNLITHLLKQNCEIPERRKVMGPHQPTESYGMRWQVPWGKHTPAKFRDLHATEKAGKMKINKDWILPVLTLRNPYTWLQSTCKNSYTARWKHRRNDPQGCPSLKDEETEEWNNVTVHYGGGDDYHKSMAHLWNDWYSYYLDDAKYPWIAIRMEDIIFYPKETVRTVCECAGGAIRTDREFVFITGSAKADSRGHDASTGLYEAWVKYSKSPIPKFGFTDLDYEAAKEALNANLMETFGYQHPPPY